MDSTPQVLLAFTCERSVWHQIEGYRPEIKVMTMGIVIALKPCFSKLSLATYPHSNLGTKNHIGACQTVLWKCKPSETLNEVTSGFPHFSIMTTSHDHGVHQQRKETGIGACFTLSFRRTVNGPPFIRVARNSNLRHSCHSLAVSSSNYSCYSIWGYIVLFTA